MVALRIRDLQITTSMADTGNTPMTGVVITGITIIKGIGMTITAIGGLGVNGIDTQKRTRTFPGMEPITAKMHI